MDFFNKLAETITDTSKVVAQKAKDVAEISRITGQISAEESRINAAYLSIGKRFYEENAGEVMEAYIQDFSVINESKAKIQSLKEQLKQLKGVSKCPQCGAEVPANSAFCSFCGAKLMVEEPKEENVVDSEEAATKTEEATAAANEAAQEAAQADTASTATETNTEA